MEYLILFLYGIITFISPCLLPMLPVYAAYFAGGEGGKKGKTLINALGFVIGFSVLFILLGAFAGTLGRALNTHKTAVDIVFGSIVVLFGLSYMGLLKIPFLNFTGRIQLKNSNLGFFSSILFGIIFSAGWTPCAGTYLGSALMFAAVEGERLKGVLMLLCYSLGLGIPFVLSALLIDRLKTAFDFIKRNYKAVNYLSGGLLVAIGLLMATGNMGYFLALLTF